MKKLLIITSLICTISHCIAMQRLRQLFHRQPERTVAARETPPSLLSHFVLDELQKAEQTGSLDLHIIALLETCDKWSPEQYDEFANRLKKLPYLKNLRLNSFLQSTSLYGTEKLVNTLLHMPCPNRVHMNSPRSKLRGIVKNRTTPFVPA